MSFPVQLSPSPIQELFQWVPKTNRITRSLSFLPNSDKTFLLLAEDNPLEYTLYDQAGADRYISILHKILAEIFVKCSLHTTRKVTNTTTSLTFDSVLLESDTLELLRTDPIGVLGHYTISRLTESIQSLKQRPKGAKATLSSTFYPSGILQDDWKTLFHIASDDNVADPFIQRGASYCLSCILVEGNILESRNHLFFSISLPVHEYVCWLLSQLQLSAKSLCKILPGLTTVVSCPAVKTILGKNGGVGNICHHLRVQRYHPSKNKYNQRMRTPTDEDLGDDSIGPIGADSLRSIQLTQIRSNESDTFTPTSQQQYELMYCLWVMSLDVQGSSRARADFQREGVVAVLADLIAVSPREKTVRLALSILKNLADCNDATTTSLRQLTDRLNGRGFLSTMIGCGILKSLQLMATRQWNDQDMENDLEILTRLLSASLERMTQWDIYEAEVESGRLRFGAIHESDFFRKNVKRFEGSDGHFFLVQRLVQLTSSEDDEVAAIACYDIGEFVRFYPQGKTIAKQFGTRNAVVKAYNQHESAEVRHNALICLSKMLVSNWKQNIT